MQWKKSQNFVTALFNSRYLPFIWLIHTGWQTTARVAEESPHSTMANKRRPSVRTRMKAEDVECWVEHNQPNFSPRDQHHVRFETLPPTLRDDSDSESEDSLTEKPVYMDGGYGWVVTAASFIMHAVCDGTSFCFGIMFPTIQSRFNADRVSSAFAASLFLSLPLCLSPIAGIVSDITGCRVSILIGAIICTVSCGLSYFAKSIWVFTLTFGLGCGTGMSFIYNAAIVIVTYYFEKHRGLATSIAVSGTGVGTFIFPFYMAFAQYLLTFADDIQAVLISFTFAYFLLVLIGYFIKDVEWESDKKEYKIKQFEKNVKAIMEAQESAAPKIVTRHACSLPDLNISQAVRAGSIQSMCEAVADGKAEMPARSKSVALFENKLPVMPPTSDYTMCRLSNLEHLDLELANSPCTTVKATRRRVLSKVSMSVDQINEIDDDEDFKVNIILSSSESSVDSKSMSSSELSQDGDSSSSELSEKEPEPTTKLINKNLAVAQHASRATSSAPTSARFARPSLAPGNTNVSGGRIMATNALQSRYISNLLTMGKIPSAPMLVARKKRRNMFLKMNLAILKRMTENEFPVYKTAIKNRSFQYLLFSVSCLYFILDVPYVCFYEYATEHLHMDPNYAKGIYSVIGVANFFSTVMYGKLADCDPNQRWTHILYAISMMGVCGTMAAAALVTNGFQLMFVGAFFGVFVTSNYVLQSILITMVCDDMNAFQGAYSMVGLVEGLSSLFGPSFFSMIREETGSWTWTFGMAAFFALMSAIFLYLLHREELKREREEDDEDSLEDEKIEKNDGAVSGANATSSENQNLLV